VSFYLKPFFIHFFAVNDKDMQTSWVFWKFLSIL
jgi:hypothetical protein